MRRWLLMFQKKTITTSEEALKFAVKKLAMSDYSQEEILDSLLKRKCSYENAQAAIERLLEFRYIDDEKLCKKICSRWQEEGVYGINALKLKLLKRGINKSIFEQVLIEMQLTDEQSIQRALTKYTRLKKINDQKSLEKLMRHLSNKGFKYNDIQDIIKDNFELPEF